MEALGQADRPEVPFLAWRSGSVFDPVQQATKMRVAETGVLGDLQRKWKASLLAQATVRGDS